MKDYYRAVCDCAVALSLGEFLRGEKVTRRFVEDHGEPRTIEARTPITAEQGFGRDAGFHVLKSWANPHGDVLLKGDAYDVAAAFVDEAQNAAKVGRALRKARQARRREWFPNRAWKLMNGGEK